ncbi:MAG: InlB B-repeat-containing protein, partial [Fibrobacteraceae bacterium]|nr:InlB B-repeat-containing protein [Fibrobacteraceae bacterium]
MDSLKKNTKFNNFRIALANYEYWSNDYGKYKVADKLLMNSTTYNCKMSYAAFADFFPTPGSVSWNVSSYTHDGVDATYTADDYPKDYDFIRSEDVIKIRFTANPDGDTTKGDLQYYDGKKWAKAPDSLASYTKYNFKKETTKTITFRQGNIKHVLATDGYARLRFAMYKDGSTDTLYTPEIKLNMQYLVKWEPTENLTHGKQWISSVYFNNSQWLQGFEVEKRGFAYYDADVYLRAQPKRGYSNRADYDFECWKNKSGTCVFDRGQPFFDDDERVFGGILKIKSDTTIYASFIPLYSVDYYDYDGSTKLGERVSVKKGESVSAPATNPTREGYTFAGWYETYDPSVMKNPENYPQYKFDFTKAISDQINCGDFFECDDEDRLIKLYAAYTVNKHHIYYNVDKFAYAAVFDIPYGKDLTTGSEDYSIFYYESLSYVYNQGLASIVEPQKTGYTFSGWAGVPATMPDANVVVKATFAVNKHNIVYKVDGKEYQTVADVAYGTDLTTITAPDAPTKTGYTFSGWSALPAAMPDEDVFVTGTFTVNKHYVVYKVDDEVY